MSKQEIPEQENPKKQEKKLICSGCKLLNTGSFMVTAGCPVHNKLLWTLPKPRRRKRGK
jgi:hypothetical protein